MWPADASILEVLADVMQVVTGLAADSDCFHCF